MNKKYSWQGCEAMKIETKYHGQIEVNEKDVITFEHGIPGFLEEKKFILLPFSEDSLFLIMQSVETQQLGFVLTNPFHFFRGYDIELPEYLLEELGITSEGEVEVYSILTVQDPFEQTTVNLQAPIVINIEKKRGKQLILGNSSYTTRHQLVPEKVR